MPLKLSLRHLLSPLSQLAFALVPATLIFAAEPPDTYDDWDRYLQFADHHFRSRD